MKVSIILAVMFIITSNAMAAKCTEAQKAKGGVSKNMSDESGGYMKNKNIWICEMPSTSKGYHYVSPDKKKDADAEEDEGHDEE